MAHTVGVAEVASGSGLLNAALRSDGHVRHFRRGQAVFTEGDRAERVFLIESGWVLISCTSPEGREIVLGIRGGGEVLGGMSTLDGEARSATAVAIGDVETTVSSGATFGRALEDAAAARELV